MKFNAQCVSSSLLKALLMTSALAAPALSFAQSNSPVTRAQVRAELVELEKVGYNPGYVGPHYPDEAIAAEAKVAALHGANSAGGGAAGTSVSGHPGGVSEADWNAMYSH